MHAVNLRPATDIYSGQGRPRERPPRTIPTRPDLAESINVDRVPPAPGRPAHGKGSALVPESLHGLPVVVPALWLLAVTGWIATAAGLYRGLSGLGRRTALIAHFLTAPGVVLVCALIGMGSLSGTLALTAEWWALLLATRLRPERLVASGSLPLLAAWSALTALAVAGGTHLLM
jgi:hypothetical protein